MYCRESIKTYEYISKDIILAVNIIYMQMKKNVSINLNSAGKKKILIFSLKYNKIIKRTVNDFFMKKIVSFIIFFFKFHIVSDIANSFQSPSTS